MESKNDKFFFVILPVILLVSGGFFILLILFNVESFKNYTGLFFSHNKQGLIHQQKENYYSKTDDQSSASDLESGIKFPGFENIAKWIRESYSYRLPILLPKDLDNKYLNDSDSTDLYAQVHAGQGGYMVLLYYGKNCFEDFCSLAVFSTDIGTKVKETSVYQEAPKEFKKVTLKNNITGYYHEQSCTDICSPEKIMWEYGNSLYEIEFYGDSKEEIVSLANDSIQNAETW